jgi:hypothetical protein
MRAICAIRTDAENERCLSHLQTLHSYPELTPEALPPILR